jgi:hypothetical protein
MTKVPDLSARADGALIVNVAGFMHKIIFLFHPATQMGFRRSEDSRIVT